MMINQILYNHIEYYWIFSTNSLIDIVSINYHIIHTQNTYCIKINKNEDFIQLLINN